LLQMRWLLAAPKNPSSRRHRGSRIARLADLGSTPLVGSATDFGKLIADETEKWGNVIRTLNIKAE
jgi:hypothetical protein